MKIQNLNSQFNSQLNISHLKEIEHKPLNQISTIKENVSKTETKNNLKTDKVEISIRNKEGINNLITKEENKKNITKSNDLNNSNHLKHLHEIKEKIKHNNETKNILKEIKNIIKDAKKDGMKKTIDKLDKLSEKVNNMSNDHLDLKIEFEKIKYKSFKNISMDNLKSIVDSSIQKENDKSIKLIQSLGNNSNFKKNNANININININLENNINNKIKINTGNNQTLNLDLNKNANNGGNETNKQNEIIKYGIINTNNSFESSNKTTEKINEQNKLLYLNFYNSYKNLNIMSQFLNKFA